jgi:F-type H+-transporting ATPase subunit alpha
LDKGSKLTELLKQPVHQPMATEEEVASIFSGVRGYLTKINVENVKDFEKSALEYMRETHPEYLEEIKEKHIISPELDKQLSEFYAGFVEKYLKTLEKAA